MLLFLGYYINSILLPADGEVAAVGEQAPEPLQRAKQEMPEPQTTQIRLEHEDSDSREYHKDQAEGSAQAEADAIEEQDAARSHLRLLVVAQEGPESELGVVGYGDTQQGEAPQGIEDQVALSLGGRSLCRHRLDRLRSG